jgi:peptide deformylase
MIHPILLYGDPMLKQRSGDIPSNFPKNQLEELINDMFETMHKANGVGLSAIQIGIPYRIFVVEAHLEQEDFHFRDVFINPYIKNEWGPMVKHPEGCLSVPQLTALVERRENIELEYYDTD